MGPAIEIASAEGRGDEFAILALTCWASLLRIPHERLPLSINMAVEGMLSEERRDRRL